MQKTRNRSGFLAAPLAAAAADPRPGQAAAAADARHRGGRSSGRCPARLGAAQTKLAGLVGTNAQAQADLAAMNTAPANADAQLGTPPSAGPAIAPVAPLQPAADMASDTAVLQVRPCGAALGALGWIKFSRIVAEITLGMRGSGVHWPADVVPDTTNRTGGSRMLLDELLAERERAQTPPTPTPAPVLTVDPVAVPPTVETGRRAVRQRLAELESAARRNYRSAEEARRVLLDEHQRLEQELNARTHAQQEAAALRREVERLNTEESRRRAQERTRAERSARAQIAHELKRFQDEHERVVQEMSALRSSLSEHDGLLDEYVTRLRDEQGARAALRAELERAEAARSLAERSLQRATENARHGAEDEMIRLATAEQDLADARSDRDRLRSQLTELTSGDGAIARMTTQIEGRDAEIVRLGVRIADLSARIDASEDAAREALSERDHAAVARTDAEARLHSAEKARADAEMAVDAAAARIQALEAGLQEHIDSTDTRAREIDKTLGKLRRDARDASNARRTAEGDLAAVEAERDALAGRVADLEAENVRARADGDRLRAHAAMLGDELSEARATIAELQAAAASAPSPAIRRDESSDESSRRVAVEVVEPVATDESSDESSQRVAGEETDADGPPPLPLRIAGRHAPAPPLARRRPRRDPAVAKSAPGSAAAAAVALIGGESPTPLPAPAAAQAPAAEEPEPEPEAVPAAPVVSEQNFRRTALAEFTALASSSSDDFSFRRR